MTCRLYAARLILCAVAAGLTGCGGCRDDDDVVADAFDDLDADVVEQPDTGDTDVFEIGPEPDVDTDPQPDTPTDTDADGAPDADADTAPDTDVDVDPGSDADADASLPDVDADTGPVCGNGVVEADETCDDGNVLGGDGCAEDCTEELCGDGRVTPELGEACEPTLTAPTCAALGLAGDSASCDETCQLDLSACRVPTCGDGVVDDGESCDDGGREPGDGCDRFCRVERCLRGGDSDGDGVDDCDDVEVCDGLDNDGDGLIDDHPTDVELDTPCWDEGDEVLAAVGACSLGRRACVDGALVCVDDVAPRAELCNGVDDDCDGTAPAGEAASGCVPFVVAGAPASTRTVEMQLRRGAADTALVVDRTPSMAPILDGLAVALDGGALPDEQALGLGTFADLDLPGVGAPLVDAWRLERRVSWGREALAGAVANVDVSDGGDRPEAGLVALGHVATGAAVTWDAGEDAPPSPALVARREAGDVDEYVVGLAPGDTLYVEATARRERSQLDAVLTVLDPDGAAIARNDDTFGLDPVVRITATRGGEYTIRLAACCDDDVPWGETTGWYALTVLRNDRPQLPTGDLGSCERAEQTDAVALVDVTEAWPYDAARCATECVSSGAPPDRVASFCGDGSPWSVCGDGLVGWDETCDGEDCPDGCRPSGAIAAFDPTTGFVQAAGHGRIGGVGFRAGASHSVLHVTDAPWHTADEYAVLAAVSGLLDLAQVISALNGEDIDVSALYGGSVDDAGYGQLEALARATGAIVPACAFDAFGRPPTCPADTCCVGEGGAGVEPDADGMCAMAQLISPDGADVDEVLARRALALPRMPVTAQVTLERGDLPECAVVSIASAEVLAPACASAADITTDGDGLRLEGLDIDAVVRVSLDVDASACDAAASGEGALVLSATGGGTRIDRIPVTLIAP